MSPAPRWPDEPGHPYPPGGPPKLATGRHASTPLPPTPFVSAAAMRRRLDDADTRLRGNLTHRTAVARWSYFLGGAAAVAAVALFLAGWSPVALLISTLVSSALLIKAGLCDGRLW